MSASDKRKAQAELARQLAESFGWVVITQAQYADFCKAQSYMMGKWHRDRRAAGLPVTGLSHPPVDTQEPPA